VEYRLQILRTRAGARGARASAGAAAAAILAVALLAVAPVAATSSAMAPACDGVNIRTAATTSSTIVVKLGLSSRVTVSGTVSGAAWGTACPTWKSGSGWYTITAVDGTAVSSRYGVPLLYAATGVLTAAPVQATASPAPSSRPSASPAATAPPATAPPAPTPSPTASATAGRTYVPACDGVNIRASTSTSSTIKARLGFGATVMVSGTTSGSAWSTSCPTAKAGSDWYVVTQVNGTSVKTLFGVAALYAATGVLVAAPTPTTPTTGAVKLGASTTFFGRGYGHGVGLSQYGARGRALTGQTAAQILAHYYQGTSIGSIAAGMAVRVLVLDDFTATAAAPLTIVGRGGTWAISGVATIFPAGAILRLAPPAAGQATWHATVRDSTGAMLYDAVAPATATIRGTTAVTTLQLISKPTNDDLYRGTLRWILAATTADIVNDVSLETYLRGVVPAEMPSSWPTAALAAQTIAARSYTAYRIHPSTGTFDVYDDTRSQVYRGVRAETAASDATIAATANQVLRYGTALVNALFHSTGGGATENNENVFTSATGAKVAGAVGYLRGSSDRDPSGASYDAAAPYATWQTAAYTVAQLSSIFGADSRTAVGTLVSLDLSNRGVSGRLISVTLSGSAGSRTVSGQVFVDVFNAHRPTGDAPLRSTLLSLAPIS
jgi:stage II sporulation protein D